jgi:hypothetical protein
VALLCLPKTPGNCSSNNMSQYLDMDLLPQSNARQWAFLESM